MKATLLVAFALLAVALVGAADKITPFKVKPGLWEVSMTNNVSGQLPIPQEMLDKMTPEQRAKMEAAMQARSAQGPKATTYKSCITQEKLDHQKGFREDDPDCSQTVLSSTGSKVEMKIRCNKKDVLMEGTVLFEAVDSQTVKGSVHMSATGNARKMDVNGTYAGKWLGSDCGDQK